MSVTVTLHVFSGVPDPTWELTNDQANELANRIRQINKTTFLKPQGIIGGLGYRGFSIQTVREKLFAPYMYIHGGVLDLERFDANLMLENSDLEEWLLSTAGSNIEGDVTNLVQRELAVNTKKLASSAPSSETMLRVPPYDPGKWNNDPNIRAKNNCYNYANDKITNTFAQPGLGSGQTSSTLDCGGVGLAAQRDGQVLVSSAASTPVEGHFIALVIWPGRDYHWYRCDSNGMWSHKPGQTQARNTDNSGRLISNPNDCDRGPYTSWCGYYHCIPANTRII